MQKFSQFTVFRLQGINLLNDFGQVGIVHDVVHNAAHKFRVRHERGLNVFYVVQRDVVVVDADNTRGPGLNTVQPVLNFINGLALLK